MQFNTRGLAVIVQCALEAQHPDGFEVKGPLLLVKRDIAIDVDRIAEALAYWLDRATSH